MITERGVDFLPLPALIGTPIIPSQRMENVLGYDVEFRQQSGQFTRSLFLQHKVTSYAENRSGRNAHIGDCYRGPYYRFPVERLDRTRQHNLLVELDAIWIFSACPAYDFGGRMRVEDVRYCRSTLGASGHPIVTLQETYRSTVFGRLSGSTFLPALLAGACPVLPIGFAFVVELPRAEVGTSRPRSPADVLGHIRQSASIHGHVDSCAILKRKMRL